MGYTRAEIQIIFFGIILIWFGGPRASVVSAQSDKAAQQADSGEGEESQVSSDDSSSHRSVNGRFLADLRSPIGFSLGISELYAPSLAPSAPVNKSTPYTLLQPDIFLKIRRRHSEFDMDYAFGYRRTSSMHTSDHSARVDYSRQMSRDVTVHVSDAARSVFNDFSFLSDASSPLAGPAAQQLYAPRQRATTNTVMANMSYRAGKNSDFSMFGTYDTWRYTAGTGNLNDAQVGFTSQNRINRWLSLDNRFSHYFTIASGNSGTNQALLPSNIDSLQAGGLTFRPRKTLNVSFSGGGELAHLQTGQRRTGSFDSTIARKSRASLVALVYHRGFSTIAGATLNGQTASISLNQTLSRRVSFQVGSAYTTGTSLTQNLKVESLSASGEFDVAIRRNLVFSSQYSHLSQKGSNLPSNTPGLKIQNATAGLRFFLPSAGR